MPDDFELFRLADAPAVIEQMTGRRLAVRTIQGYRHPGRHGVRLKTRLIGRAHYTCQAWLEEYFDAVTRAAERATDRRATDLEIAKLGTNKKPATLKTLREFGIK